jgi:hypothetical protein
MRNKIILGIALVIVAVLSVIVYLKLDPAKSEEQAVLVLESGLVTFKLPGSETYQTLAQEETYIPNGSFIKTEKDSYARVFFPDNSLVSLDQQTEIQVVYNNSEITIQQLIGKTWNRVQTVAKGGSFKVETPNTIAAVRGTVFGVEVDQDQNSSVNVDESEVEVSSFELDKEGKVKILKTIKLNKDQFTRVQKAKLLAELKSEGLLEDQKLTFWYIRNKILDKEYNQYKGEIGPRFRARIRGALILHPEFGKYLFGFKDLEAGAAREELKDLLDLVNINQATCERFTAAQIQNAIYKVRRYSRFINKADKLEQILLNLQASCKDGKFSVDEAETLDRLVNDFKK